MGRHREVLHQARQVAEAEVDDLDTLLLDDAQDLSRVPFSHVSSIICARNKGGARSPPSRSRPAVSLLLPDC
jgi:hypothetical protein